jgi:hypothetical protein
LNELKTEKQLIHHHIVGLGTGYIDPKQDKENEIKPRTQRIVVVLSNWKVICFDHDLNLVWETTLSTTDNEKHYGSPLCVHI